MERDLAGVHTLVQTPDGIYKPHSDVQPLPGTYTNLAREAIGGVHPTPSGTMRGGYIVNVKSLFGDADFWRWARDRHPSVFGRLVDRFKALPSPYPLRSVYAASEADPVGLVKAYYPQAFLVIHAARPDFDSDAREPLRRISRR